MSRMGDGEDEREEDREEEGDASSYWSASGTLDRLITGVDGLVADAANRPQTRRVAPVSE